MSLLSAGGLHLSCPLQSRGGSTSSLLTVSNQRPSTPAQFLPLQAWGNSRGWTEETVKAHKP